MSIKYECNGNADRVYIEYKYSDHTIKVYVNDGEVVGEVDGYQVYGVYIDRGIDGLRTSMSVAPCGTADNSFCIIECMNKVREYVKDYFKNNPAPLKVSIKDVHTEHCCLLHGCKYNDDNCTVVTMQAIQSYPCEDCDKYHKDIIKNMFENKISLSRYKNDLINDLNIFYNKVGGECSFTPNEITTFNRMYDHAKDYIDSV